MIKRLKDTHIKHGRFKCPKCSYMAKTIQSLAVHQRFKHGLKGTTKNNGKVSLSEAILVLKAEITATQRVIETLEALNGSRNYLK